MEKLFKRMNDRIVPDSRLNAAILEAAIPRKRLNFRPLSAVAAVLAVILLTTPVMAAYVEPVNELLYQLSPEMAERFTPIRKTVNKNGIQMEVLSASVHGNVAEIVVSFEDFEGERLTRNFLPEFNIRHYNPPLTLDSGMRVEGLTDDYSGYDTETGKAIYLLTFHYLEQNLAELFENKITLICENGYRWLEPETYSVPLELTDTEIMTVEVERGYPTDHVPEVPFDGFGTGAKGGNEEWNRRTEYNLLTPGESAMELTKEAEITGIAFVDGQLHIQSRSLSNIVGCDTYLVDQEGNRIEPSVYTTFTIDEGKDRGFYKEEVFDITEAEMENYTLEIVVSASERIEGPWKVTFEFEEVDYDGDVVAVETEVPVEE